jgi:4-oxalocrotonate tautomerase
MPQVIVKMHTGRSEQQKERLAQEVPRAVVSALGCAEDSVSVAIEDVKPSEWTAHAYQPDIAGKPDTIYKKPDY